MDSRGCLLVCLFSFLAYHATGQVASLCRPNERFLPCGCQKTCKDPAPECSGVCRTGCFCNDDEVRNETGHCVKLADCPPAAASALHTSEPRTTDMECPESEEYRFCEPCNKTCDNPNPICPAQCARGCFCVEDLVRDRDGRCVKKENCSNLSKNESSNYIKATEHNDPITNQMTCGAHQVYNSCQTCERTCSNPYPVCQRTCKAGCFCEEGYLKAPSGQCVKMEDCPKVNYIKATEDNVPITYQMTCGPHQVYNACQTCEKTCSDPYPNCEHTCNAGCFCEDGYLKAPSGYCVKLEDCPKAEISVGGAQESSVEDCQPDEVYLLCGWCEPSCSEPRPQCPQGACTRGCLCRPPLLRHHSGHCVEEKHCSSQKCPNQNEEYVCRYGCEARCDTEKCSFRPRRCVLGCHCKLGLLRDVNDRCVLPFQCITYNESTNTRQGTNTTIAWISDTMKSFADFIDSPPSFKQAYIYSNGTSKSFKDILSFFKYPQTPTVFADSDMNMAPKTFRMEHFSFPKFKKDNNYKRDGVVSKNVASPPQFVEMSIPLFPRLIPFPNSPQSKEVFNTRDHNTFKDGPLMSLKVQRDSNDDMKHDHSMNFKKVNTDVAPLVPLKDMNMNSYVSDILNAVKDILPQPINFTVINYPIW